jgi:hypothetical protein
MSPAMPRVRALLVVIALGLVPAAAACLQGDRDTKLNPQPLPPASGEEGNDPPAKEGTSAGADFYAPDAGADAGDSAPE